MSMELTHIDEHGRARMVDVGDKPGTARAARAGGRIFVSPELYRAFVRRGGRISVRQKSSLLAVCVNPVAPNGIVLDSDTLCRELSAR
ncbi:MAG: hypothetical protein IJR14_05550, partial [Synergistaceae bacterium]|nr:hypothetical protein [Synergistaceae bacterium]